MPYSCSQKFILNGYVLADGIRAQLITHQYEAIELKKESEKEEKKEKQQPRKKKVKFAKKLSILLTRRQMLTKMCTIVHTMEKQHP